MESTTEGSSMSTDTTYEVQVVYAGAAEREEFFDSYDQAQAFADREAADCRAASKGHGSPTDEGEDWAVYLLPHYCAGSDEECVCRQYDTDHHPYAQSDWSD
jgi:hypothetical protein